MAKRGSTIRISNKSHKNVSLLDFEPLATPDLKPSDFCNVRVDWFLYNREFISPNFGQTEILFVLFRNDRIFNRPINTDVGIGP
jgi:hypothetical protein